MYGKKILQKWRLVLTTLGIVSVNILPVSANSKIVENAELSPNNNSSIVALDFLDAIGGAIQFIQVSNISDEQEIAIGKRTNEQILNEYQLYNNDQVQDYVSNLGQELVNNSDSRDIPFNFQVVVSDQVNAFAVPGGYIYITTGLLKTADNRAQLASVMAHEIAHINKRHSIEALKQAVVARGIASTVGVETNTLAQVAYQLAVDLPQSRSFEYEADTGGLDILQQAGYPAEAFANFLAKLESSGGTPEFLRTHPTSDNRIEAISQKTSAEKATTNKGQDKAAYRNNVLALM
ncbi:MAG: hypothetical protein Tsb0014_25430 [Pleurocapsa sp.]